MLRYLGLLIVGACGMALYHHGATVEGGSIGWILLGAMIAYGAFTQIGIERERNKH